VAWFVDRSPVAGGRKALFGHYLNKLTTSVRNYGVTDVRVTNYQVQVLWGSTIAATKSTAHTCWSQRIPAAASYSHLPAQFVSVGSPSSRTTKVGYKDKYGNTGSVSATYINDGCPGCWDY
jgi:hypothetical protein